MATCIGRCLSQSGIIEQDSNFAFWPHFRAVLFSVILFFGELSPAGWSGGPFGWCCSPSSLLLGGVVLLFHSPFVWCCLSSHPLGGAAFSPLFCWVVLLRLLLLYGAFSPLGRFFLKKKFSERAPPRRGRGRQHDQKEEAKQPGGEGGEKAASLKGRRRDCYTTDLNFISTNRKRIFHFLFGVFLFNRNRFCLSLLSLLFYSKWKGMTAPPKRGRGKQHHPKGGGEKAPLPTLGGVVFPSPCGWCGVFPHPLGGAAFLLSSATLLLGGAAWLPLLLVVVLSSLRA